MNLLFSEVLPEIQDGKHRDEREPYLGAYFLFELEPIERSVRAFLKKHVVHPEPDRRQKNPGAQDYRLIGFDRLTFIEMFAESPLCEYERGDCSDPGQQSDYFNSRRCPFLRGRHVLLPFCVGLAGPAFYPRVTSRQTYFLSLR
jgi:hypothetical protein